MQTKYLALAFVVIIAIIAVVVYPFIQPGGGLLGFLISQPQRTAGYLEGNTYYLATAEEVVIENMTLSTEQQDLKCLCSSDCKIDGCDWEITGEYEDVLICTGECYSDEPDGGYEYCSGCIVSEVDKELPM